MEETTIQKIDRLMESYLDHRNQAEAVEMLNCAADIVDLLVQITDDPDSPMDEVIGKQPLFAIIGGANRRTRTAMEVWNS